MAKRKAKSLTELADAFSTSTAQTVSRAQQLMLDDGLPAQLLLTQEQRSESWKANPPPQHHPAFYDAKNEQQRELRERLKREATELRIKKLLANKARRAQQIKPEDIRGKRWDPRSNKFIPIDREAIMSDEEQVTTPTAEQKAPIKKKKPAAKAKVVKAKPKAKKTKGNSAAKKEPKKSGFLSVIAEMLTRRSGVTNVEAAEKLGWKSISIPRNARTLNMKIRKEKQPGKPARFYAV
jgi:hypothetical protein